MSDYGVVMPAFNAAHTLRETLESVLAQTVEAAEIIVVDDGSTDDTVQLASRFAPQVRVVQQAKAGPGAATSRGVRALQTPFVATVDADDLWLPQKMETQLRAFAADSALALVSTVMRQFRHGIPDDGGGEVRSGATRSTIVFRREVFFDVGDFVDQPGLCGDSVDWLARVRQRGHKMMEIDDVLALRRSIPGSLSQRSGAQISRGLLAVARQAMLRSRAATV